MAKYCLASVCAKFRLVNYENTLINYTQEFSYSYS